VTANPAHDAKIPPPLAEGADTATRPMGPCALCGRAILRSHRFALVVPSGHAAHVACIARRALAPARRAA
jgi:hypothetical protein